LVGGKPGAAEVVLSSGFSFDELEPITARIVLNRSMVYFTGDEAYAIKSPDVPLEVAAVKVNHRSKATSSFIVYDSHWKRWVLKLPVDNRVPSQFHLEMPELRFHAEAGASSGQIPWPYGPLSGSQTLHSTWTATLAWDASRYNSKLPAAAPEKILSASYTFSGNENPWTVPFGNVFDGGELVVTAKVTVPKRSGGGFYKVAALDSWKIFARAERQTKRAEVKKAAQDWINAHPPKGISDSELRKWANVMPGAVGEVACRETQWKQYNDKFNAGGLNLFPWVTHDGGYGMFQLTSAASSPEVWDWVRNTVGAVRDHLKACFTSSYQWLQKKTTWAPGHTWTEDQLLKMILACYNGGTIHYWKRIPDPTKPSYTIGLKRANVCCRLPVQNNSTCNGKPSGICYADIDPRLLGCTP